MLYHCDDGLRYAAFDLDGTVLDAGGATSAAVVSGVARLRDLGLLPIIVTGRSRPGFLRLAKIDPLLVLFYAEVLLEDGDIVLDRVSGGCRTAASLPSFAVDHVVRNCADVVGSCGDGRLVASNRRAAAAYALAYRVSRRDIDVAALAGPTSRLVVFGDAPPDVPGTQRRSLNAFGATVVTAAGRGKAAGLADLLAERFGEQDLARVVAFGDGDNDADLLAASRVGIAVSGCSSAAGAAARICLDRPLGAYLETVDLRELVRTGAHQTE
ncbi:HAD hydrolase family protein [Streptomyces samsunensis]|uniref:HAD family hydrolase n=1 Tax=Streptomyces malaysiensis TaxID=92644 RepID=UPI001583F4B3|nr:HAD hydrolase family protein [Streptomyces samsunensis]NUH40999.1 HAD hydrolase family protein [Streptomyces samsunensis]